MALESLPVVTTILVSVISATIWISKELEKNRDFSRSNVKVLSHKLESEVNKVVDRFETKYDKMQERVDKLERQRLTDKAELKSDIARERHRNNNQDIVINSVYRTKKRDI